MASRVCLSGPFRVSQRRLATNVDAWNWALCGFRVEDLGGGGLEVWVSSGFIY